MTCCAWPVRSSEKPALGALQSVGLRYVGWPESSGGAVRRKKWGGSLPCCELAASMVVNDALQSQLCGVAHGRNHVAPCSNTLQSTPFQSLVVRCTCARGSARVQETFLPALRRPCEPAHGCDVAEMR